MEKVINSLIVCYDPNVFYFAMIYDQHLVEVFDNEYNFLPSEDFE